MSSFFSETHDLILTIISALEARDSYTSNHSSRVAEMTEALCGYLQLSKEETELYHIAAHLHDIGKIGIRDNILLKEDKLTEQEWQIMKSHSVKGYQILMNAESFKTIAPIVRSHHERWDGKGYPDGLKGTDIPFGSRIIAIADSLDAMMSDRPYRKGLPLSICKSEIEKNIGIIYDPDIARKALENWDDLIFHGKDDSHDCIIG